MVLLLKVNFNSIKVRLEHEYAGEPIEIDGISIP